MSIAARTKANAPVPGANGRRRGGGESVQQADGGEELLICLGLNSEVDGWIHMDFPPYEDRGVLQTV